jgi:hypothetical protein
MPNSSSCALSRVAGSCYLSANFCSEFQARAEAESVAFDAFADVEVMNPPGVKIEMGFA